MPPRLPPGITDAAEFDQRVQESDVHGEPIQRCFVGCEAGFQRIVFLADFLHLGLHRRQPLCEDVRVELGDFVENAIQSGHGFLLRRSRRRGSCRRRRGRGRCRRRLLSGCGLCRRLRRRRRRRLWRGGRRSVLSKGGGLQSDRSPKACGQCNQADNSMSRASASNAHRSFLMTGGTFRLRLHRGKSELLPPPVPDDHAIVTSWARKCACPDGAPRSPCMST